MEKKVFCYLRVSTSDQIVDSQDLVLRQYCEHNGIKNPEFFVDHGISGTKVNRPALDKMMALVEADQASTVIVYSFSRFARSTTHLLNALQVFKRKNVQFVSLTERIDTSTPVGVAMYAILAAISQLERDLIASRVKAGLEAARARGKLIGRKKMRDSDLIRKLIKSGLSYRAVSKIANTSHGSVSAEVKAMKAEEAAAKKKLEEQAEAERQLREMGDLPEIQGSRVLNPN